MNRSKCVICGKNREQQYLRKLFKVWVCNRSVATYNNSDVQIKVLNGYYSFNKCQIVQIKRHSENIKKQLIEFNENLDLVFTGDNLSEVKMSFMPDIKTEA